MNLQDAMRFEKCTKNQQEMFQTKVNIDSQVQKLLEFNKFSVDEDIIEQTSLLVDEMIKLYDCIIEM